MTKDSRKEVGLAIYRMILALQRKARTIRREYKNLVFTNSEIHILVELDSCARLSAKDLIDKLNLEKSTISRVLSKLENNSLIKSEDCKHDRRFKYLKLSAKGSALLAELDQAIRYTITQCLSELNSREESELCFYITKLADGFNALPHIQRNVDHPITIQLRRFTRATGMLSRSFLDSKLNLTEAQGLDFISSSEKPIASKDICQLLPFNPSRVSRTVSKLESDGLLRRVRAKHDKRIFLLEVSSKGEQELASHRRKAAESFASALSLLSLYQLRRFAALLRKSIQVQRPAYLFQDNLRVSKLESSEERDLARGFYIEQMVYQNKQYQVNPHLFLQDGFSYGLYSNNKLAAVCEVQDIDGNLTLTNFTGSISLLDEKQSLCLLRTCLVDVLNSDQAGCILVPKQSEFRNLLSSLQRDGEDGDYVIISKGEVLPEQKIAKSRFYLTTEGTELHRGN